MNPVARFGRRSGALFYGLLCLLLGLLAVIGPIAEAAKKYEQALPGFVFRFPRDHASHSAYKTEWWYYTGHLKSADGRTFGYELTFFRVGTGLEPLPKPSAWSMENVYLAHFALTDDRGRRFHRAERLSRAGVDMAGADTRAYRVWNKTWSARLAQNVHVLSADLPEAGIELRLDLRPAKPPVIHGRDGISQKSDCVGCASHYYSITRLNSRGTLTYGGNTVPVSGESWMDHEFGSNQLSENQIGWDWFSVQFNPDPNPSQANGLDTANPSFHPGSELMLYRMRQTGDKTDPHSSGTWISATGQSQRLNRDDFSIQALGSWKSPKTGGRYPSGWRVRVPGRQLDIVITPTVADQELTGERVNDVPYWEGRCRVQGVSRGKPVSGQAYVELTGYAKVFRQRI